MYTFKNLPPWIYSISFFRFQLLLGFYFRSLTSPVKKSNFGSNNPTCFSEYFDASMNGRQPISPLKTKQFSINK